MQNHVTLHRHPGFISKISALNAIALSHIVVVPQCLSSCTPGAEDIIENVVTRANIFSYPTPTFPPDGPIRLGAIIPSPKQPDEPLHLPPLPSQSDTSKSTEHNWSGSYIKNSLSHFGVWTSFLEEAVGHEDVKRYITEYRFKEKIYMITGVMIASSTKMSSRKLEEKGVYIHAGVDARAWTSVPISVGPEGNWKRKAQTSESSQRADDFVFEYEIREIKVGRKGGIKSNKLYKGALFDTEKKRREEEQYEVEVEGMGEELDPDEVEADSREVSRMIGMREERTV